MTTPSTLPLLRSDNPRIRALLASVIDNDDAQTEALVTTTLQTADEAELCTLTTAPDADLRFWAVRALAVVGTEQCMAQIAQSMVDPDAGARAAAALAAGLLHQRLPDSTTALPARLAALLSDDEGLVRQVATDALVLFGDAAVDALRRVLAGPHDGARTRATLALGKIATMQAAAVLYPLLNDSNYLVRAYAYDALDAMGLLENLLLLP